MLDGKTTAYKYRKKCLIVGGSFYILIPKIWAKANNLTNKTELDLEVYPDEVRVYKRHS